jgi:hypothetical protein
MQDWYKLIIYKVQFNLEAERVFVAITPSIPASRLKHHMHMRHNQCKFGQNRAVIKGTLLLSPEQFFTCISPRIALRCLKYATCHSLRMRYVQYSLG